jgi:hypothetical protein
MIGTSLRKLGWAALTAATPSSSLAQQAPTVRLDASGPELQLPASFRDALARAAPGFVTWQLPDYTPDIRTGYTVTVRQTPWAVVGDFDADGNQDLVVEGHTAERALRLCILARGREFEVLTLDSVAYHAGPRAIDHALLFVAPGRLGTNFSDDTVTIFADGFEVYFWEKAGSAYYWKNGHFEEFATSD